MKIQKLILYVIVLLGAPTTCLLGASVVDSIVKQYVLQSREAQKNNNPALAIEILQTIVAQYPENGYVAEIDYELGMLLYSQHNYQQAAPFLNKAVHACSQNAQRLFSLANNLGAIGELEGAITALEYILKDYPNIHEARYNYAYMLKAAGKLDQAIQVYHEILAHNAQHDQAHLGLAFAHIMQGDFENGWREHLWNLNRQNKDSVELRNFIKTNTLSGKTILLIPEGGLGDTINFIRYAALLKKLGATVIVRAQAPLCRLLARCPYIDQLLSPSDQIPYCHARATLMSLPALFGGDEAAIPRDVPYIFSDPLLVNYWKQQLETISVQSNGMAKTGLKIGICWQADVFNDSSRTPVAHRGIPLTLLAQLSTIPGVTLYSLQKKNGVDQLVLLPSTVAVHSFDTLDEYAGPFVDTTAIMENLDLIISIDSAIAHVAGALGRPVWLLLPYVTDWRWMHGRTDSPWYPTMRIFKQPKAFDWHSVVEQVHDEVEQLISLKMDRQ